MWNNNKTDAETALFKFYKMTFKLPTKRIWFEIRWRLLLTLSNLNVCIWFCTRAAWSMHRHDDSVDLQKKKDWLRQLRKAFGIPHFVKTKRERERERWGKGPFWWTDGGRIDRCPWKSRQFWWWTICCHHLQTRTRCIARTRATLAFYFIIWTCAREMCIENAQIKHDSAT